MDEGSIRNISKGDGVLEIKRLRLDALLRDDIDLERKLYRNMLGSLCGNLRDSNSQLLAGTKKEKGIAATVT